MSKRYCYDCKYDVRGEDGIMITCKNQNAAICCARGAFDGEMPFFEQRDFVEENGNFANFSKKMIRTGKSQVV